MSMYGQWDRAGVETDVINQMVDFTDKDVLEVGCGSGRVTWRFAERTASVLAVDPKEDAIQQARENTPQSLRSRVTFECQDVVATPPPEAGFDVVVFSWSM